MNTPANIYTFKEFLFKNRRNRITLYLAAIAIVIQFSTFKYLYPFASYIHGDSFSYLDAADKNLTINTYLIGYSKFLRIFSIFAKSDYILVSFQYLFIQCSVLFLMFTIFYFYRATKTTQAILLCFMVFNPLFWHLGNMVSSDGFFLSLSCIWFALLLWIIHQPNKKIIIWHAVVLFIAFITRYNALIYPAIAALAFVLSKLSWRKKLYGMGLALILCGLFVGFTSWRYKILTGYWQYSPFSGWQLANNAMYMYRHIDSTERKPVPAKFKQLDKMVQEFFSKNKRNFIIVNNEASTFYMWSPGMPLMDYRNKLFKEKKDTSASELKKWASMGPFYKAYGSYLIRHNFRDYIWYFARYNARKYYAPPIEFLEKYNDDKPYVTKQAAAWFGYKSSNDMKVRMGDKKVWTLDFYPILSGIINVLMLFSLLYYTLLKGWKTNAIFNKIIIIAGTVWFINAGFTIFVSSAALRFQAFPVILSSIFASLLVDWMAQLMRSMKSEARSQTMDVRKPLAGEQVLA